MGPVEPNLYPYSFVVDGVSVADPNNPDIFPNEGFKNKLVDIPGDKPSIYSVQDVPHGEVSHCYYNSKTLNATRPLVVYTPPGYRAGTDKYPVLYLVSGTTDTEETWHKGGPGEFHRGQFDRTEEGRADGHRDAVREHGQHPGPHIAGGSRYVQGVQTRS